MRGMRWEYGEPAWECGVLVKNAGNVGKSGHDAGNQGRNLALL